MPIINRIADSHTEMTAWRHDFHTHPETAFEERRTAELVAGLLESFGIAVARGVARTGVIGTLKGSAPGDHAIALRADMDALHVHEKNDFAHASRNAGRMHACGHDGHTAMLLRPAAEHGFRGFRLFSQRKPGACIWIGNGAAAGAAMLHNPHYDFNDEILPLGASYWARLAEDVLTKDA